MTTKIRIKLETRDGQFITDVNVEHKLSQMRASTIIRHVANHLETTEFGNDFVAYGMKIELLQP